RWTVCRPGAVTTTSFVAVAVRAPTLISRTRATPAPAGAVNVTAIPRVRAVRDETRRGARRPATRRPRGFAGASAGPWRTIGAGAGASMMTGAGAGRVAGVPTPVSAIACGLPTELLAIDSVALRVPVAWGANVIPIVQLVPGATAPAQPLLATWKSAASAPPSVAADTVRSAVPWLLSVTV